MASVAVQLVDRGWRGVLEGAFDGAVAQLLGVELWGVRGQPLDRVVVRVGRDEVPHWRRAVGVESVPDDEEWTADAAAEVAQGHDDPLPADAAAEVACVEPR